jgi:hypothetical protein
MWLSRAFYLWLTLIAGCTNAFAQNANDFLNIFGGLIKFAIVQNTLTEWRKLPQNEVACVDQNLRKQGSSLQIAIQSGIMPSDPRIAVTHPDHNAPKSASTSPNLLGHLGIAETARCWISLLT